MAAAQRPASLIPFALVSAAYFAHIGFFNPYLPLWLKSIGQPLWAIGVLTSVQSLTRLFMPYVWGWLGDVTGRPVLCMRVGASCALLGCVGLWAYSAIATPTFVGLFIGLLCLFMPTSAIIPTSEALLTKALSHGGGGFNATAYGRLRVWGSVGFLVTVLGSGLLFDWLSMQAFMPMAALTLAAVVCSVFVLPNIKEKTTWSPDSLDSVLSFLKDPKLLWFFSSVFFHVLSHMGVYLFLSLWLDANGYGKSAIGALWALGVGVEIVVLYAQGPWLARLKWTSWLMVCAVACAIRMGAIAFGVGSVVVLVLAQMLHGLTFATHHTAVMAFITRAFPAHMTGRGQALYAVIGYGASGVIGGFVGAGLSERYGLASVFVASVFTSLAALYCAWRIQRNVA